MRVNILTPLLKLPYAYLPPPLFPSLLVKQTGSKYSTPHPKVSIRYHTDILHDLLICVSTLPCLSRRRKLTTHILHPLKGYQRKTRKPIPSFLGSQEVKKENKRFQETQKREPNLRHS